MEEFHLQTGLSSGAWKEREMNNWGYRGKDMKAQFFFFCIRLDYPVRSKQAARNFNITSRLSCIF